MQLSLRPSSKAASTELVDRADPTLPAILEFQSPSTAIVNAPVPRSARSTALIISGMVVSLVIAISVIKVDKVVTAQGKVVSVQPTVMLQPLDTSIVRSIDVRAGDRVQAGQVLARLDPTFAAADLSALTAQVGTLQAQVSRMQAELDGRPFTYSGNDANLVLQTAIYAQRQAEYNFRIEGYQQKANSLSSTIGRARADADGYRTRLQYATSLEGMRKELERLNVGSKINTLAAMDLRADMQRNLSSTEQLAESAQRDLAALIAERNAFAQNWRAEVAERLAESLTRLSDARESLNKAQLHRQLVELRAETDGTILSVAKVSVGSVLTVGQPFISLVPSDAPLEVEANLPGNQDGYVQLGDPASIKFNTFDYSQYGLAYGTVRMVSPDSFTILDEQRNPTGMVTPSAADPNMQVWYRSRVTLDRVELRNLPDNYRLMPGMPVTVDIKIGMRTVMQYILGRIIPLTKEGMREP
jgi:HlyD family secretion protein